MSEATSTLDLLHSVLHPEVAIGEVFDRLLRVTEQCLGEPGLFPLYPTGRRDRWIAILPVKQTGPTRFHQGLAGRVRFHVAPERFQPIFTHEDWILGFFDLEGVAPCAEIEESRCLERFMTAHRLFLIGLQMRTVQQLIDQANQYSKKRKAFGVPIHQHQLVSNALVVASTEYTLNRLFLQDLAAKSDQEMSTEMLDRQTLYFLSDSLLHAADTVLPVLGAFGLTAEAGLHQHVQAVYQVFAACKQLER